MEKLLKDRGDPKEGLCRKWGGGGSASLDIFSSWGEANLITVVTFNYVLVMVFLLPLNVGVSPCFPCTV